MLALLTDRALMQKGEPQNYGTQYVGAEGGTLEPWPTKDRETVDDRRLALGLMPLDENTARLNAQHARELAQRDKRRGKSESASTSGSTSNREG